MESGQYISQQPNVPAPETEKMPAEDQLLLAKLDEIPVVHDGWNVALGYYTRVKDYNSLTKFTLGAAESSLKKAAQISTPVVARYQSQIESVNSFACNKLEDLEAKYPLIKQPTEEVKDACVEYVQPVIDRVKPVVSYVNGVVDNTQKTVNNIKTTSTNLVVGARDLGVNTVSQAVTLTLETPPGRLVTRTLDYALVQTDSLIDKYIPEEEQSPENDEDDSSEEGDEEQIAEEHEVEQMEEMPATPARVAIQLRRVSSKLRRRLHQRARSDFELAKTRTMSAISQLQQTLDLRDYSKINLMDAYNKAQDIWSEIREKEDHSAEEDLDNSNSSYAQILERRIINIGRIITRQVRTGVASLEKASAEAGLFVKDPISKSREYKDLVYQFGSESLSSSIVMARETVTLVQKRLLQLIESVESSEWLGMDIDMEGINLAEDDDENQQDNSVDVVHGNHVNTTSSD